jgi:hypothetical protein
LNYNEEQKELAEKNKTFVVSPVLSNFVMGIYPMLKIFIFSRRKNSTQRYLPEESLSQSPYSSVFSGLVRVREVY